MGIIIGQFLLLVPGQNESRLKKKTSEIMNKIIRKRIPLYTIEVWHPWKVASRVISRHHWYIHNNVHENIC